MPEPQPPVKSAGAGRSATPLSRIEFPKTLPVSARREEIAAALREHQVIIVCGETGSGKTTQLPKICLELGRGGKARADRPHAAAPHRRLGVASADRPGAGTPLGEHVGYKVRFNDTLSAGRLDQADDRRHPAGRDADRSAAAGLRHDHHRRGARAQPEHRLPARLPEAAAAAPARPEGHHHLGDHRRRALRAPLRQRRQAGAGDRGLGPPVSGRGALPAGRATDSRPWTRNDARRRRPDRATSAT